MPPCLFPHNPGCWAKVTSTVSRHIQVTASGHRKFSGGDLSFPIHCVCPVPALRTRAFRGILVCCGHRFAVDPARKGVATSSTPESCSAT
jgi:hypothetical protein